ncbi:glycosyltransferase [bacterium]|nr:glycosyltransferase [candidate division CSSED10-310 bacterium]
MIDERSYVDIETYRFPEITVAVCVRNGASSIESCLQSVTRLDYPAGKLKILVVNNGSTDETEQILARFSVTVIDEKTPGRGFARNTACNHCTTPFIAFTDADCRVSPEWLREIVPVFEDPEIAVAGGDIITPGDTLLARFFESRQIVSNREFSGDYPYSPPFLATANAVFRLDAILNAGGFRTRYRVAEDADICWRISEQGGRIQYIQGAAVYHDHRSSLAGIFYQAIDYGHDGVAVHLAFHPETRVWIWWGLYYRLLKSLLAFPAILCERRNPDRYFPIIDSIRYTGLSLGRISAGIRSLRMIL